MKCKLGPSGSTASFPYVCVSVRLFFFQKGIEKERQRLREREREREEPDE